ncbi:MAG: hypothetical protein JO041_13845 [Acidobacteria bacterium]|nr:hypothetical protein [Acidobacteriota bacterium]
MASSIQQAKLAGFAVPFPRVAASRRLRYEECYETNRHRVYAVAFWMTDHELAAEELMRNIFLRAFASADEPTRELVDRALIAELREFGALGLLTLQCAPATETLSVRHNIKRIHLERAVVQLPRTERLVFLLHDVEAYDHCLISRLLGLTEAESRQAVHQARLRIRELVAAMN